MASIVAVTPNPALDVTYTVAALDPSGVNRVQTVVANAGGKGVNVARVARALGLEPVVVAPLGGADGARIAAQLANEGIPLEASRVEGETRRTLTVVDERGGHPLSLNEPGPQLGSLDLRHLLDAVARAATGAAVVTVSGSLPPGMGGDALRDLVNVARPARVIVDTSGPALLAAADARADLLKPNADELRAATGLDDTRAAAAALLERGAGAVLISRGPDGLELHTPTGRWRTVGLPVVAGNPTGAGDAVVAAIAVGLAHGRSIVEVLPRAAAAGAAAVLQPIAGIVDPNDVDRIQSSITCEECP